MNMQLRDNLQSLDTLRLQIEMAVEMLIGILDLMDGDADLEPSLGLYDARRYPCDGEEQCEDEGGQCDDEGDHSDSGIADSDGLMEQVVVIEMPGCAPYLLTGFGGSGLARFVE